MIRTILLIAAIVASPAAIYVAFGGKDLDETEGRSFVMPAVSAAGEVGRQLFVERCGACHGDFGEGTGRGPALVHDIYAPSLLGDRRIRAAIRDGAPARHWPFGDMPPVSGLGDGDLARIVAFIRLAQRANGIE